MTTLLTAHGVRQSFGAVTVLAEVALRVDAGEVVGVVGPNGAGKTTLLDLLAGALPLQAGAVRLAEADVSATGPAARCRAGIARTHQVPRPFGGMTVFENAVVAALAPGGGRRAATARAVQALDRAGLIEQANRPAAALGLLDRKRLELARALATAPRVLLLDEVAGGLTDAETEHIVHVLVRAVDRLVCLAGGVVVADGDPREVIDLPAVRAAYFGGGVG